LIGALLLEQNNEWARREPGNHRREKRQARVRSEAHDLLAPAYGWFTAGFDTADWKEAKALLGKLTEPAIAAQG
jgi:hypothetical protein